MPLYVAATPRFLILTGLYAAAVKMKCRDTFFHEEVAHIAQLGGAAGALLVDAAVGIGLGLMGIVL